jgi:hypothetical protein
MIVRKKNSSYNPKSSTKSKFSANMRLHGITQPFHQTNPVAPKQATKQNTEYSEDHISSELL